MQVDTVLILVFNMLLCGWYAIFGVC